MLSSNDLIGEESVSLAGWLQQIYKRRLLSTSRSARSVYFNVHDDYDRRAPRERPKGAKEEEETGELVPGLGRLKQLAMDALEGQPLLEEGSPELEGAKFWLPMRNDTKLREAAKESHADDDVCTCSCGCVLYYSCCCCLLGSAAPPAPTADPTLILHQGQVMLSIQLVPIDDVERSPAGHGRSEPNSNPPLPKPTGRLTFSLNPCKLLTDVVGAKYIRRVRRVLGCFCCVLLLVLILYYTLPVVFGDLVCNNLPFRLICGPPRPS